MVIQQVRNLTMMLAEGARPMRYLVRDRDAKFTPSFDEVFRFERIRTIRTPVRAPRANAFAERFVGTIRRECLDRMQIFHRRQLEAVLAEYIDHYNKHCPHRSLEQASRCRLPRHRRRLCVLMCSNCEERSGSAVSSTSTDWLREPVG